MPGGTTVDKKEAAGRTPKAAETIQQRPEYPRQPAKSRPTSRNAWLDRAAVVLTALLANLQQAVHVHPAEREGGWAVFEELLGRYVTAKRQRASR